MGLRDRVISRPGGPPVIGKLFHLAHLVEDLETTDRMSEEVFACRRIYHDDERVGRRTASLNIVADQCLEPVWCSDDVADAGRPLQRFKARWGYRPHSIAWYVDDITVFTDHLLVDAVAPTTTDTPEGSDHASAGQAVHAVTFATVDLDRAVEFLAGRGIDSIRDGVHQVWLGLDPGHGIRIGLTGDPVVPLR